VDGSRRIRITPAAKLRFPGPRDRRRWEAAGRPEEGRTRPVDGRNGPTRKPPFFDGAHQVTYAQLLQLPRDPQALYRHLHDIAVECDCGHGVDSETFVIAGDLLRDTPLPTDLRAALLRAVALIPGIKLIHHERDVAGRPGVAVAYDDNDGERSALIFDSRSYELLGENIRSLKRLPYVDAKQGALIGGSADLESAIVGSFSERP